MAVACKYKLDVCYKAAKAILRDVSTIAKFYYFHTICSHEGEENAKEKAQTCAKYYRTTEHRESIEKWRKNDAG